MERNHLILKVATYSVLIGAGVLTVMTVLVPILIVGVIVLAVLAYALLLSDMKRNPVETDVVMARRTMGRNVTRDWDTERRDVDRRVDGERGDVTVDMNLWGPRIPFKRSKWARRRE